MYDAPNYAVSSILFWFPFLYPNIFFSSVPKHLKIINFRQEENNTYNYA
jgi:hypothetical protein